MRNDNQFVSWNTVTVQNSVDVVARSGGHPVRHKTACQIVSFNLYYYIVIVSILLYIK